MREFYRGPRVLVTDKVITVQRAAPRSFVLAELHAVHIVRQRGACGMSGERVLGISALVSGIVIVPVVGRVSVGVATVTTVVALVYAFIHLRLGPPAHHELVATYRGVRAVVFESDDQREFEQVCRGLQRALERLG
ncbi:DUF6232 family protein [Actinoplanes sp. NPDC049118]|uniref:DUF6232 family protein n=1 Tax=Actinoplanes sp. NPDC049118 TaxID=3155769 RepID=UPI0033E3C525